MVGLHQKSLQLLRYKGCGEAIVQGECVCVSVCVYIYIYTHTHAHTQFLCIFYCLHIIHRLRLCVSPTKFKYTSVERSHLSITSGVSYVANVYITIVR